MKLQSILGKKKYIEASEDFMEVKGRSRRGSVSSRDTSRHKSTDGDARIRADGVNVKSTFSTKMGNHLSSNMSSLPLIGKRHTLSNRSDMLSSSRLNDQSMLSLWSQRSSIYDPADTTEFAMNHIMPFNLKLQKLSSQDEFADLEKETSQVILSPEAVLAKEKAASIKKGIPVKKIYPNSNVSVLCLKDKDQFYAVPYEGYSFPMTVNFNMKVLVKVMVSFTHIRPNYIENERVFNNFVFQVTKPSEHNPDPKRRYVFMCVSPQCDFKTEISVKFDGREFKPKEMEMQQLIKREFSINYREFEAFSEGFIKSMRGVKRYIKKIDTGLVNSNINLIKDYSARKFERLKQIRDTDSERREIAIAKCQKLKESKMEEFYLKKLNREKDIIMKRILTEKVTEKLVFATFQRTYLIHHYLILLVSKIHERYSALRKEKKKAKQKMGAAFMIASYFCKLKKRHVDSKLAVIVSGKHEVKVELNLTDMKIVHQMMQMFGKINRFDVYARSKDLIGAFFFRSIETAKLSYKTGRVRKLVFSAQKSFKYLRAYKAACVEVYSKLLLQVQTEINQIGTESGIYSLLIEGKVSQNESKEIIRYFFEYYLWKTMKKKFLFSDQPHKEFPTLERPLKVKSWGVMAEDCLEERDRIRATYPSCVNIDRLNAAKKILVDSDPNNALIRNKKRDEEVRKLGNIFTLVKQRFKLMRFTFEFDDIDAKLMLLQLNKIGINGPDQIEELIFDKQYIEAPASPLKLTTSSN